MPPNFEGCIDSGLNSKSIIDSFSQVLPASDVPFGRLHRRLAKEKLNLLLSVGPLADLLKHDESMGGNDCVYLTVIDG